MPNPRVLASGHCLAQSKEDVSHALWDFSQIWVDVMKNLNHAVQADLQRHSAHSLRAISRQPSVSLVLLVVGSSSSACNLAAFLITHL